MAKVNSDNLVTALIAAPSNRSYIKAPISSEGAGTFQSLRLSAGYPTAGAAPPAFSAGAGYVPTKATLGAFPFVNAAVDGDLAVLKFSSQSSTAGTVFAADRLWHCSGFSTLVTTAQTIITPGTLPAARNPNTALDVEPWLEIFTAPGATAATWTLTGTDALGNANRTWIYAHPANAETVGQKMPMFPGGASPAAAMGCAVPTSLTCSVSSGTAGNVGLVLLRRLATASLTAANIGDVQDILRTGGPPVFNNSCVELFVLCTGTTTGTILGDLVICESPVV
jgi:hypothetical protein